MYATLTPDKIKTKTREKRQTRKGSAVRRGAELVARASFVRMVGQFQSEERPKNKMIMLCNK